MSASHIHRPQDLTALSFHATQQLAERLAAGCSVAQIQSSAAWTQLTVLHAAHPGRFMDPAVIIFRLNRQYRLSVCPHLGSR